MYDCVCLDWAVGGLEMCVRTVYETIYEITSARSLLIYA